MLDASKTNHSKAAGALRLRAEALRLVVTKRKIRAAACWEEFGRGCHSAAASSRDAAERSARLHPEAASNSLEAARSDPAARDGPAEASLRAAY